MPIIVQLRTLPSSVSKILERRVAATQTLKYLVTNGLLAKLQWACRDFYSTETALLRVFNDILCAIDSRQEVVLVLLDLSTAAFDTIDHAALLARLKYRYGICGTMLKWFEPYLVARIQQVQDGGNSPKLSFFASSCYP